MNFIKKLALHTMTYGATAVISRLLNYLLSFLLFPWVLSAFEIGIITDIYALASFFLILLPLGLENSFFRYQDDTKSYSSAFNLVLISGCIFLFIAAVFYGSINSWMGYGENVFYIPILAGILFFDVISIIPYASLRKNERPKTFSFLKILATVITVMANLLVLLFFPSRNIHLETILHLNIVEQILFVNLFASFITFCGLLYFSPPTFFSIHTQNIKKQLRFSLPLLIAAFLGMINENFDKLFIDDIYPGSVETKREIQAIYGTNYKFSLLILLLTQAFRYAFEPFIYKKEGSKKEELKTVLTYYVLFAGISVIAVVAFLDVLKFLIPETYHKGISIVPILLFANVFMGINYNFSTFYKLSNQVYYGILIFLFGASITIILNILLIPEYSYYGAAISTLACYGGMSLFSYLLGQKVYPVNYEIKKIIGILFVCFIATMILLTIKLESFYWNLVIKVCFFAFFAFFLFFRNISLKKKLTF